MNYEGEYHIHNCKLHMGCIPILLCSCIDMILWFQRKKQADATEEQIFCLIIYSEIAVYGVVLAIEAKDYNLSLEEGCVFQLHVT